MKKIFTPLILSILIFGNCTNKSNQNAEVQTDTLTQTNTEMQKKINEYAVVKLSTDLSSLTVNERKMLPLLLDVAKIMDDIFWLERIGNKEEFLNKITDEATKKFALINYGPWDNLDGNKSFINGYGVKAAGAFFYPEDMTKEEFEKFESPDKTSLYTVIRRKEDKSLYTIPYHEFFKEKIAQAVDLINQAAVLAEDAGLKKYLELRAKALQTDDYFESDIAWMSMKTNTIDFVVGPIENYEDELFGYKAAHESFLLLKDKEWSKKLEKFAALLPELQTKLPVESKYKAEKPGSDSDLGVYYTLYYAGDCNAGGKTIAINLPNDEKVQLQKGTRKLQLKNSMLAKFDKMVLPISNVLIDESQRQYIKFDSFFENVMFHEVGHGLGIKNTLTKKGTVRDALKEQYSAIEEAKADLMGLFLVDKLNEMGQLPDCDLKNNYATFMAGIFRSVRFGAASAHGKANMITFYYFEQVGAFTRNETTGLYSVNFDKMKEAVASMTEKILTIQGDGNYDAIKSWIATDGIVKESLQKDLDKLATAGIPKDIVFEQGNEALGL
ncbi:MAG: Zn-dependent hydrolase [Bacteroidetes bacterium GWA2_30_7]|nr:MAG: Zn-dependent hydrolase [Bacteroidetes bacterium GWA2_30_7]